LTLKEIKKIQNPLKSLPRNIYRIRHHYDDHKTAKPKRRENLFNVRLSRRNVFAVTSAKHRKSFLSLTITNAIFRQHRLWIFKIIDVLKNLQELVCKRILFIDISCRDIIWR
jgi:hypothetical protein